MKLRTRKKTPAKQLKQAAIEAAVTALGDRQDRSKGKPALSGVRAVGTGAVLVTAARAAFKGRRFLREQLSSNEAEREETTKAREQRAEPEARKYQAADRGRKVHDARDPDTESSSKPARPLPDRRPVRHAAREKGLQPSLELPQQRWPRLSASKR